MKNQRAAWYGDVSYERRSSYEMLQNYNRVLELLASGNSLREVLDYLVQSSEAIKQNMRCSILLLHKQTKTLHLCAAPSLPDFYNEAIEGLRIGPYIGSCGAAAYTGKRVIIQNVDTHSNWKDFRLLAKRAKIAASWSEPILSSKNEVLGTFAMYYDTPSIPTQFDLDCIHNNAHIAAIAIEKCQGDQKLADQQAQNLLLLNSAGEGIYGLDVNGQITFMNPVALHLLGYEMNQVIGKNIHAVIHDSRQNRTPYPEKTCFLCNVYSKRIGHHMGHEVLWRKDGSPFPVEYTCTPILKNGVPTGAVITFKDISEQERAKKMLSKLAHTDYLTGLASRNSFEESLNKKITEAKENNKQFALLFIDLNDFKNVNDTLGHNVGDLLLKEASTRMSTSLRRGDIIARLGGDEFAVLTNQISSPDKAVLLAEKIITAISSESTIMNYSISIGASVGIACFPSAGTNASTLKINADIALYKAKNSHDSNVCLFTESLGKQAKQILNLKSCFHSAIQNQEFSFDYQPQVDLKTNKIVGVEALLRWTSPKLGHIKPKDFTELIEYDSLVKEFNLWCVNNALQEFSSWPKKLTANWTLAINLAPSILSRNDFVTSLISLLKSSPINLEQLVFEITEAGMMVKLDLIENNVRLLHELGPKIAIDDFGTGYSSFARLSQLPIEILKIDRTFIKDVTTNVNKFEIVSSIINLSKSLNLRAIAEGVELKSQIEILRKMHCFIGQGYYFSKPLSSDHLLLWASERVCSDLK